MTRFTSLEHCITNVVKDTVKMWKWLFVNLKMFNCRVVKRNSGLQLLISEIERAERQNGNIVPASIERLAVAFPFTNFGRLRFEFSYRTGITVFHFIIFTFYFSNCVHLIRHAGFYYFPCTKSTERLWPTKKTIWTPFGDCPNTKIVELRFEIRFSQIYCIYTRKEEVHTCVRLKVEAGTPSPLLMTRIDSLAHWLVYLQWRQGFTGQISPTFSIMIIKIRNFKFSIKHILGCR